MRVEIAAEPQPELVDSLLRLLPAWFGIESSIVEYVTAASRLPALIARADDDVAVGVLVYERHFPETVEIHVMAVEPSCHRRGAGRALVAELERVLAADGTRLLAVKTLGPTHPDEGYQATRQFYRTCGFLPVEELLNLWPGNPCLLMIKPLKPG